jgi:predicted lipoprotein with Yx(FWY)xxD motif
MAVASLAAVALVLTACSDQVGASSPSPSPAKQGQVGSSNELVGESGPAGLRLFPGTAKVNKAQRDTGDWAVGEDGTPNTAKRDVATRWVQLRASAAGELDPVVVNGAGLTLYRFDNDDASPSKSNCVGDCAITWPPVLVRPGGKVFLSGVRKGDVGFVEREDGALQVTIGGWPVYRFAKDENPGDTNGQGVGGTWFGVTPQGGKAGAPEVAEDVQPPPNEDAPLTARSAVLFDEPRFSDNGGAQGVSGTGCQNVPRRDVASSISLLGTAKLWSAPDCTGDSVLIDGDVADLTSIDFDDRVRSIGFAD